MNSPAWSFVGIDWGKVATGAAVAVVGALLTYGTAWVSGADFGSWTPVVVALWSVVANIGRKFVNEYPG